MEDKFKILKTMRPWRDAFYYQKAETLYQMTYVFVNRAGIPCVDIIDMRSDSDTGFCPEWHTIGDTMDAIDAATLSEVGQTLLNVIAALEQ